MKNKICIDFYQGAYGPSIRFGIESSEELLKMIDLFQNLEKEIFDEIRLHEMPYFQLTGFDEFHFKTVKENRKKKIIKDYQNGRLIFTFFNNTDGWARCGGLIDGIAKDNDPGHQYLSEENIDDALIIIAYKES
jgi:hypothetical protein